MTPLRAKIEFRRHQEWQQAKSRMLSGIVIFAVVLSLCVLAWSFS